MQWSPGRTFSGCPVARGRGSQVKRITVALAALLVLGTGAVALAAIPSADGTITGCRDNRSGALRVIDAEAGQSCTAKETALTWNQTGPAGPPGVAGVHTVRSEQVNVPIGTFENIRVECPEGEVALSGGYDVHPITNPTRGIPTKSTPLVEVFGGPPVGWEVRIWNDPNTGNSPGTASVFVSVVCATTAP
jgi:hypothetical protein